MFNSLTQKTGNLASTVWQNANTANAKAAWGTLVETAGAVTSGIGYVYKQTTKMIDRNEKLKETFACYHLEDDRIVYVGTIHFTSYGFFFSCEGPLPQHIKNTKRDLPLLPPGEASWKSCYEKRGLVSEIQITLKWGDISEINTGENAENPLERYIKISTVQGYRYIFKGFLNYQKAFAHIYSLLESSS